MEVLRNFIGDSLSILLRSPRWLEVAQLPLDLQAQLPEVFAASRAICQKLVEAPEGLEKSKWSLSEPRRTQSINPVMNAINSDFILGVTKPLMNPRKSKREFLRNMICKIAQHFEKRVTEFAPKA